MPRVSGGLFKEVFCKDVFAFYSSLCESEFFSILLGKWTVNVWFGAL